MSNFFDYPKMAHVAKMFGGPKGFVAFLISSGVVAGGVVTSLVTYKITKKKYSSEVPNKLKKEIKTEKEIKQLQKENGNPQILFDINDEIEVLEDHGDVLLVKRKGDSSDSYYIPKEMFENMTNKK